MTTCSVRGCDARSETQFRWPTSVGYRLYDVCAAHAERLEKQRDAVTTAFTPDRTDRELVLAETA